MGTGGNLTVGNNPLEAQFSERILTDTVAEARRGLHVAAQCHNADVRLIALTDASPLLNSC